MDLITTILSVSGSVVVAVIAKIIVDDVKEWTPRVTVRLMGVVVRMLPEPYQARYREEWASHLADVPGVVGKFVVVISLPFAALRLREDHTRVQMDDWNSEFAAILRKALFSVEHLRSRSTVTELEFQAAQTVLDIFVAEAESLLEEQPALNMTLFSFSVWLKRVRYKVRRPIHDLCRAMQSQIRRLQRRVDDLDGNRNPPA